MVTTWLLAAALVGAPQVVALYGADETTARELQERLDPTQWEVLPMALSPGNETSDEEQRTLDEAIGAFDSLMFEEAVPLFRELVAHYESAVLEREDMERYLLASLYLARTWEVLGEHEQANTLLDEVARRQPDLSTLLERFPPGFRARVGERVAQLPSRRGALRVESHPRRAEVWVNGRLRGHSPLVISELPGGKHTVTIARSGHAAVTREITVTAGFGIGADATPELLEVRLVPDVSGAAEKVLSTLTEQRLPNAEETEAIREWHRRQGYAVGVYVAVDSERTTVGLLKERGPWRGPEPFAPEVLQTPPVRARLVQTVADWLEAPDEPVRKELHASDLEPTMKSESSRRAWLWTGVGAVVVGGITAAAIGASGSSEPDRGSVEIFW